MPYKTFMFSLERTSGCKIPYQNFAVRGIERFGLSPSRRREAPCEGTNYPRLFTPGETKALAKSKVHQSSWALTNERRS